MKNNFTKQSILGLVLVLFCLFTNVNSYSQGTAINSSGSSPDNSAMLDVSSITQGFLMPRISLTSTGSASPVTAPAVSLMVYNNATAGDVTPGFYFWNASNKWERFGSVSGSGSDGYVAFWNSPTTLSYNSWLYYDYTNHMLNLGSGASGYSGARLNVKSASVSYDAISGEHTSPTSGTAFAGISGSVANAAYTTAQGFLGYHNSSATPKTFAVYGKGGDWGGVFDAKVLIGNNNPSSTISTSDLEVQNTIAAAYTPTPNLTIRQTTSLTTNGDTLGNLNFGDNYRALAQARISVTRGAASSSSTDLPTDMAFGTTADGSDVLTERMRIANTGNVGIGTNNPGSSLDVKGTVRISGSASGYVGLTVPAAAGSTTYTLPSADGANGEFLKTNGSGTLSWGAAGGGGGNGATLQFPDGASNITPILKNNLQTTPYTVPVGQNLYITGYYAPNSNDILSAGGKYLYRAYCGYGGNTWDGTHPFNPFIIPAGTVVSSVNNNNNAIIGFTVAATVTPVVLGNLLSTPYTVPVGKTLYITNYHSMGGNYKMIIGGIDFYRGMANYSNNVTGFAWDNIRIPMPVAAGTVISSNDDSTTINGYLK